MKNIKRLILTIFTIATSSQAASLYLDTIDNKTVHKIVCEKLAPGKMHPIVTGRFSKIAEINRGLALPVTLSFKNTNKPSQKVLLAITLAEMTLARKRARGEDPSTQPKIGTYATKELVITLMDANKKVLKRWVPGVWRNIFKLDVIIKGWNLQKTEIKTRGIVEFNPDDYWRGDESQAAPPIFLPPRG